MLAAALTRGRLRVLAYHGVDDPAAFALQLDEIAARWTTVVSSDVVNAESRHERLPANAVWITFDDGDPSVVHHALPLLTDRGLKATAFLCGGWVDTDEVPWWLVAEAAVANGAIAQDDLGTTERIGVLRALKSLPDPDRRSMTETLSRRLASVGAPVAGAQWTSDDVRRWLAAGMEIGNHTWDHPRLDRCAPDAQVEQVRRAHERLTEIVGAPIDVFAWPNGDPAPAAADELKRLGYRIVLPCEHRVAARHPNLHALSRLRIDAHAPMVRFRSIISGGHSAVFHLQRRLGKGGVPDAVT